MFESFRVVSSDEYLSRRSVFAALGWSVVGATVASVMLGYRPTSALAQVPASDTRLSALKGAGTATISDPGGALTKGLAVALYEPFRKYTGIDVKQLAREHEPIAAIKSMVEAKKVFWDSTTLTSQARLVLSPLGLLEPLKWDALPFAKAELLPEAIAPDWVGNWVFAEVLAYRTDKYPSGKEPKSWADFFDLKSFPGRRAMWKNPVWTLEAALVGDGVAPKDLYPLDVARAFKKIDTIKSSIAVWYTGGAQATQLIQSGEVDMMAVWNSRAQGAIDGKAPVAIQWNQALNGIEGYAIPKGAPNAENAQKFVCFSTWAENQAAWTPHTAIAPTNKNAYQFVPKDRYSSLATAPGNIERLITTDFNWWAKNLASVQEKFDEWLLKG